MKTIQNLIFDFDGTLADTAPLIMATMQTTIHELQLPPRTDTECRATIGLRLEDVPAELWPGDTVAENTFVAAYRRIFNRLKRPLSVECFPGVLPTLGHLHRSGFRMAIASSRSQRLARRIVEHARHSTLLHNDSWRQRCSGRQAIARSST